MNIDEELKEVEDVEVEAVGDITLDGEASADEQDSGDGDGAVDDSALHKGEEAAEGSEDAGDTVVSFGDDEAEAEADDTQWIKDLRQRTRDQNKEIAELKREREQYVQAPVALGPRPTLEDAEYDAEAYEENLTGWLETKNRIDNEAWQQENVQREEAVAWQRRVGEYESATRTFETEAYIDAEDTVKVALNPTQQSMMVHILGAKLAPLIVGLGKNRTELKNLAAIKDVSLFAAAVGRLEGKMKVSRRKPKTVPETRIASGGGGVTVNNTLEVLREKAAKTGNYTEVVAYKRRVKEAEDAA